ncbi:DCC1-like thiol-disulfide oxidoreductase family protein [Chlorobium phaeobacteroides]|uniref:DCC1-like thiol-disulfide oxidoreductase family protein n=1 Tax=Chlorobium phaeobacteroides TaxID=1096 RepID=UPI001CC1490D|nr:DCC1-like thiol-disulfide oxidoreductase family protein [Chlorobium phaeobacteroides]
MRFTFTPARSPPGRKLLDRHNINAEQVTTVVLIKGGKAFTKSTAALAIAEELDFIRNLLHLFIIML